MGRLAPTSQPSSVTTLGTIVEVPIGPARVGRRLDRLVVAYESGDAAAFTATWSTDPLVEDKTKTILDASGGTHADPIDVVAPDDRGYPWDDSHHDGTLYCKVVPDAGTNNAFSVAAYLEE